MHNNTKIDEVVTPQRSCKDSFINASGDAEEAFCDSCINKDKWVAVEGYCKICQEYLCTRCLKVHKHQKMSNGHTICKTHHPEIVRFYCKAHDEPGCGDCMTLNHTACKKDRVQDISDGFQATNEFKLIQQKLKDFHRELEVQSDALDDNLKSLDTTYNNIQHKITSFRKHINDYLDQIQKQITDEAAEMKKTYETETNKLIAKNESIKSELENILQKIQNDSSVNVNSIFVITKQAKQKLDKMEKIITEIEKSQKQLQQQQNHFRPSSELENLVSANTPLGKLVRAPHVNTTATYRGTINVKTRADNKDCWINDAALLGPDRMVVTDGNSKNIRLIDISKERVVSKYKTPFPPGGVTAVSTDQVAVTLPKGSKIQLLNVTSTFTKQHEIQVNKCCHGIAYKDGKFAVAYAESYKVQILDIQGQVLQTLEPIHANVGLQKRPYIKFGPDKETVIVSNPFTQEVHVVTFKGQILRTSVGDLSGLEITPDGVLFVCSNRSGSIHVVSGDFQTGKIIIENYNEVTPNSITYCDINHRLYITDSGSNNRKDAIIVYDLNV